MKILIVSMLLFMKSIFAIDLPKEIQSVKIPQELAEQVMDKLNKEELSDGLNLAKKYWVIPDREIDALISTVTRQWKIVNRRFGKYISYELIKTQKISDTFIRYYYLQKFEKHALYWQFTFYKPKDEWYVNKISFKDNMDILFDINQ